MFEQIRRQQRLAQGSAALGILVFLVGVALLAFTFKLAIDMFGLAPADLLHLEKGKTIDLNSVGSTLVAVVVRILLLLVMGVLGGMVANRGIKLYADTKHHPHRGSSSGQNPPAGQ